MILFADAVITYNSNHMFRVDKERKRQRELVVKILTVNKIRHG